MLRILLMVLRNFWRVPGAWFKLCRYAKHTERYPEQEKYDHIRYIMNLAVNSGNIDLTVTGQDKLPKENGFILYGNHQGMFDVLVGVNLLREGLEPRRRRTCVAKYGAKIIFRLCMDAQCK